MKYPKCSYAGGTRCPPFPGIKRDKMSRLGPLDLGTRCPGSLPQSHVRRQDINRERISMALQAFVMPAAKALCGVRSSTTRYCAVWISSLSGIRIRDVWVCPSLDIAQIKRARP